MITQQLIDKLRELEAKAERAPWSFRYDGKDYASVRDSSGFGVAIDLLHSDAQLIAESRNALPDLLAEIDRLKAEAKEDTKRVMDMREEHKRLWIQIMNLKERCHELEDSIK